MRLDVVDRHHVVGDESAGLEVVVGERHAPLGVEVQVVTRVGEVGRLPAGAAAGVVLCGEELERVDRCVRERPEERVGHEVGERLPVGAAPAESGTPCSAERRQQAQRHEVLGAVGREEGAHEGAAQARQPRQHVAHAPERRGAEGHRDPLPVTLAGELLDGAVDLAEHAQERVVGGPHHLGCAGHGRGVVHPHHERLLVVALNQRLGRGQDQSRQGHDRSPGA